ncbi:MAG: elongation factor G [Dehalococcoidales bacterium]|nr:elongation factor G [Dehalococcoidales bacterium]
MQQYGLSNIRNLVLLSHSGAGKTSLSETVLYTTKTVNRLGKVDDGTTTSDYDPEEVKRRISLTLSMLPSDWKGTKINLIDTPGYSDFVGEVRAAVRVADAAMIVICAASGVEVGTQQVWGYSEEAGLPRLIYINKMDRENADFFKTLEQAQARFSAKCLPLQLPIGAHNSFTGVVDLLTMQSYTGPASTPGGIPAALQPQATSFREKLVEAIAEVDDQLIEKYLGGEELTQEELRKGLRQAVLSGKIVPVLTGSALQGIGAIPLLDAAIDYLPSPGECDVQVSAGDSTEKMKPSEDAPLAALVFKTTADPYVGKLTYFRVYMGLVDSNSQIWNANRGAGERIGQLFILRGKTQEPVPQLRAGDIGAVAKLALTSTGDTLCSQANPVKIAPIVFPQPIFSQAVRPKSKADIDKMGTALSRLVEEDPTLQVRRDAETGETILSGMGNTQLEVAVDKVLRKFGVNVELDIPTVPYRETITASAQAEYKHKKQTGGHGQYGHVVLQVEPLPRGTGVEVVDKVVGGTIPRNYIPAAEKGVNEGLKEGILAGFPVVDVRAIIYDGSFHPVDSSDICFKIAGAGAVKKGLTEAHPILLEPIANIRVTVPEEFTGDIISDLNTKRARVQGMNPGGGLNVINAQVPLAEVLRYAIDLKSITQGRGTFTMQLDHYEEVPAHITQKIVAERQAKKV